MFVARMLRHFQREWHWLAEEREAEQGPALLVVGSLGEDQWQSSGSPVESYITITGLLDRFNNDCCSTSGPGPRLGPASSGSFDWL